MRVDRTLWAVVKDAHGLDDPSSVKREQRWETLSKTLVSAVDAIEMAITSEHRANPNRARKAFATINLYVRGAKLRFRARQIAGSRVRSRRQRTTSRVVPFIRPTG